MRSTIIVGHEHTYMKFDVIRQSDVNQTLAADCYTLTADFPIAGNHANPKPRPTFYRVPHDASTSGRICGQEFEG